jgi:hypothetical protein
MKNVCGIGMGSARRAAGRVPRKWAVVVVLALSVCSIVPAGSAQTGHRIDDYSYRLGGVAAFAEMVHRGVKRLALSSPMPPRLMDEFIADARTVAGKEGVAIQREPQLLVTDLFPAAKTAGMEVLLIYTGSTLNEYEALKRRLQELVSQHAYCGAARLDIARQFGRLLSYTDEHITQLLQPVALQACAAGPAG